MSETYKERATCRLCEQPFLRPILDLGNQFLIRFPSDPDEPLPGAPLELKRCDNCGLLQLGHTVHPDLLFREFWYRSGVNQSMRNALTDVVDDALTYAKRGTWLDIGANDGYLLHVVPDEFTKIACEPALNFKSVLEEHANAVISDYFHAGHAELDGGADVITSIAMFYDLDDPNSFVHDIAKVLKPGGIWINQLNDSPTMLKNLAIDGICHEHLTYYDVPTLNRLYQKHGLRIVRVSFNDVNAGSVRVIATKSSSPWPATDLLGIPSATFDQAEQFAKRAQRWRDQMHELLYADRNPTWWAYGASTKGSTLLQYLGVDGGRIDAVADRNHLKHGKYMPGPRIQIKSEEEFRAAKPDYALVLPYAFRKEFDAREAETRAAGTTFVYPLPDISLVV